MKNIPYGRQFVNQSDIRAVVSVLKSDWLTQGAKIKKFEDALCKYTGAKYAVAVSSGTAALHIACLTAGIREGDEAITTPITFAASVNCVLYCGGKPVFADVQKDTVNIAPEEIKTKITKKTKAIIPVHFAGHPCNLEEIKDIAKRHNLLVIEDAAHALGAEYKSSKIGSCKYSDMAIFSFHPVKSITTGEGGAVLTNNKKFYEKLLMMRSHGITKKNSEFRAQNPKTAGGWYYEMQYLGFNYRITDFQCALGISQLKKLDKFIKARQIIAKKYNKLFEDNCFFDLPVERDDIVSSWHLYPIRLKDRYKSKKREIFDELIKRKIGVQVHYAPVYSQPYYQDKLGYKRESCPEAEAYYRGAISLPLYCELKNTDINYVAKNLFTVLNKIKKSLGVSAVKE